MSERRAYLYKGVGETVGVVTLDGRPERLFVEWPSDDPLDAEGVRGVARVRKIEKAFASAFVQLPGGQDVILPLKPDMPALIEGGWSRSRSRPPRGPARPPWPVSSGKGRASRAC